MTKYVVIVPLEYTMEIMADSAENAKDAVTTFVRDQLPMIGYDWYQPSRGLFFADRHIEVREA